jgi:hypothetical protein
MMKPYLHTGQTDDDVIGNSNVIEFDAENPQSKPEWLKTQIAEPVETIMKWSENIVDEIYKTVNAGALNKKGTGGQAKSGEALKLEFQGFNSFLAEKVTGTILDVERSCILLVSMWLGTPVSAKEISVSRPTEFNVQSLGDEIENMMIADTMIQSNEFKTNLRKTIAGRLLPDLSISDRNAMLDEIEKEDFSADLLNDIPDEGETFG